ncbi:hypothetical protein O2N63_03300 [Aliiroseovarius sp. KMU-50]|uniref:Uncharacterized protein n=1 Tax=Aliiroseovarius salicola TaxID=3009082 RepID=A0ABT4VXX5_9RHOB|nr:hypothetical protein [Aliiroseovarius sp. KMU-50]MDA5093105.1 hypothetical protein [Aliiroseovarius sp. KMU-50]
MEEVDNTVNFLGTAPDEISIRLEYEGIDEEFIVRFLKTIPTNDHSPLDFSSGNIATVGADAEYVFVSASSQDLRSIFSAVLDPLISSVPVRAEAVAMSQSAACDIPPLFICNPFEGTGINLQNAFDNGVLHGRIVKLRGKQNTTGAAMPGNFGYLQVDGSSSAAAIRDYFAGKKNPSCYDSDTVETKPGYATSIRFGYNVRFDIWEGPLKTETGSYSPAFNVRKGYDPGANICNNQELVSPYDANFMGFPDISPMGTPINGVSGSWIGTPSDYGTLTPGGAPAGSPTWDKWDINGYWSVNHAANLGELSNVTSSFTGLQPSRYDVYRHEIEEELSGGYTLVNNTSVGGEVGYPACSDPNSNPASQPAWDPSDPSAPAGTKDRRVIPLAIVDCLANPFNGQATVPVNSYASIFLVRPIEKLPSSTDDGTIDVEFIDITGYGGNGTLDTFIRAESILVR